jgi:hypothetical protein
MDQYWYGFRLENYNHHIPFIKKLYDQDLTNAEIDQIIDTVCNKLLEDIEHRIDSLSNRK